jgi:hypothetical protein
MFGTRYGNRVEEEIKWAGREIQGTFTDIEMLQKGDVPSKELEPYIKRYIDKCLKK